MSGTSRLIAPECTYHEAMSRPGARPAWSWLGRALALGLVVLLTAFGVRLVQAATFTPTSAQMFGQTALATPIANMQVKDLFTVASNTNLTAHPADTGQTWTAVAGTWTVNGASDWVTSNSTANGRAVLNSGVAGARTTIKLNFSSTQTATNRSAGVFVNSNAAGTTGIVVRYRATAVTTAVIEILKINAGVTTLLNSSAATTIPASATATPLGVQFNSSTGQYTINWNTDATINYTLSAADLTLVGANTRMGLYQNSLTTCRFDNLIVATYP